MLAYLTIGKSAFLTNLRHRSDFWIGIIGNVIAISIQVAIWHSVLGNQMVNDIGIQGMITYSTINVGLSNILLTNVFGLVDKGLKDGSIILDLVKPLNYPGRLAVEQMGHSGYRIVVTVLPTFLMSWALFGFTAPPSGLNAVLFVVAILISLAISFMLGLLIALLAFWLIAVFALEWILTAFITAFSGSFVPLWYYPHGLAVVCNYLPFEYLGFVPAEIYMGTISISRISVVLLIGIAWTIILMGIAVFLWRTCVKRLSIQGG